MDRVYPQPSLASYARRPFQSAYTLAELLVTIAMVGILTAGAAPSLHEFVLRHRMTTEVNALIIDLQLARLAAVNRRQQTVVCQSSDTKRCTGSRLWHGGRISFVDANNNAKLDSGEEILGVQQPVHRSLGIRFGAFGPGTGRYVSYKPVGNSKQNGTFTFCDRRGSSGARALILSRTGRPRLSAVSARKSPLKCGWFPGLG